jgi:hypothetical protein
MAFAAALLAACAAPVANERNEKTVFVTSVSFKGNLGGLKGADDKCQAEANDPASIVPSGTYLAWLSDGTDSPDTRFTKSSHPYMLPDGTMIAESFADLTDGSILHTINIAPTGKPLGSQGFWTGTNADGTTLQHLVTCNSWAGDTWPGSHGMSGSTIQKSTLWSTRVPVPCRESRRLACFQQ